MRKAIFFNSYLLSHELSRACAVACFRLRPLDIQMLKETFGESAREGGGAGGGERQRDRDRETETGVCVCGGGGD